MEYYNEGETPNHKMIKIKNINNFKKKGYKHSSTDNIFNNKKGISLDKIYNKFLTNPYLVRNSRYINALNSINYTRDDTKYFINNNYDNNPKSEEKNYENMKEKEITYDKSDELNNYLKYEDNHNNNFQNININKNENIIKTPKNIRRQILNEDNKNRYQEEYKSNQINNYKNIKYPIINNNINYNKIERPIEYNIIYKNNDNDMYYSNNKNKLSLSYDVKNRKLEDQYISPVIAKIAKHNYLMRNPFTDKEQYLGPTTLKNNPILYPISTYKFDFDRYIRNYHVNKYV